jgi:hypothetical protein
MLLLSRLFKVLQLMHESWPAWYKYFHSSVFFVCVICVFTSVEVYKGKIVFIFFTIMCTDILYLNILKEI